MRFKRTYTTKQATDKLGIEKRTLWKWGEQGKIGMFRESPDSPREFNGDEIDGLARKIRKNVPKGYPLLPISKRRPSEK